MKVFRWVEKQLYAGPNQLSLAFYSQFTLRINTATNGLGGGAKTDFAPRAQEPVGTPLRQPRNRTKYNPHPPRTRRTPACKAVRVPAPALQMRVPATRVTRRVTRPAQDSSTDWEI